MVNPSIQKLKKIAKNLGIQTKQVPKINTVMYDGKTILYTHFGNSKATKHQRMISNLAHELAHYLVASPERRKEIDFGLGPGPESEKETKNLLGSNKSSKEESEASLLGMIIENHVGHNPLSYTFQAHSWDSFQSVKDIPKYLISLEKKKLIVYGLNPKCLTVGPSFLSYQLNMKTVEKLFAV
jgi:NACalpha-BTF3-like transcription factor